jgi:hypothetical protein
MMAAPMTVAKQQPISDSLDIQLTFSSRSVIVIQGVLEVEAFLVTGGTIHYF